MITLEQLKAFSTAAVPELVDGINSTLERFDISTPRRIRYFMAHAFVETDGFKKFEEDMHYTTPAVLVRTWPSRFTMEATDTRKAFAPDYTRNPQKLANLVYSNRNGNGGPESGDGWLYRGRGTFHLTFAANYLDYSKALYGDDRILKNPNLVSLPKDAMLSAGWFWTRYKFNKMADADEFTKSTTVLNGSAATAPKRLLVLNKANTIF